MVVKWIKFLVAWNLNSFSLVQPLLFTTSCSFSYLVFRSRLEPSPPALVHFYIESGFKTHFKMLSVRWMSVILELKCERFDYRRGNWLLCRRPLRGEVITLVHEQWQREHRDTKNPDTYSHLDCGAIWCSFLKTIHSVELLTFAHDNDMDRKCRKVFVRWDWWTWWIRLCCGGCTKSCVGFLLDLDFAYCGYWKTSKLISCPQAAELNPVKIAPRGH